jgi:hypothetical protein
VHFSEECVQEKFAAGKAFQDFQSAGNIGPTFILGQNFQFVAFSAQATKNQI